MTEPQFVFDGQVFRDRWNGNVAEVDIEDDLAPWELILVDAGLCGCSDTEEVGKALFKYLESGCKRVDGWGGELLMAFADRYNLTEHGGSLGGAWCRPEGYRWMVLWLMGDHSD